MGREAYLCNYYSTTHIADLPPPATRPARLYGGSTTLAHVSKLQVSASVLEGISNIVTVIKCFQNL